MSKDLYEQKNCFKLKSILIKTSKLDLIKFYRAEMFRFVSHLVDLARTPVIFLRGQNSTSLFIYNKL